jgi:hypothetical protein
MGEEKQLYANHRQWAENKRASQRSSKIFAKNKKFIDSTEKNKIAGRKFVNKPRFSGREKCFRAEC